jgi:sucrose phosphorylase
MKFTSLNPQTRSTLRHHLGDLYPQHKPAELQQELERRLTLHAEGLSIQSQHAGRLSHKDVLLIVYPDQIQQEAASPLDTLHAFTTEYLQDVISSIHVLPFFPYSSDDGFSIIDFQTVDPMLGDWEDVRSIASNFRLMVDLVINHISSQSGWFQSFMQGVEPYSNYFIRMHPSTNLSMVVRPRDLPLLTPFDTEHGREYVWTTFSPDQVDLNFKNPAVLFEILEVLLLYIRNGAQIIRLDAIAFLWKEPGTTSIHLAQTHTVVKLLHCLLAAVAPWVHLITETNVPHAENLSYFGDGNDEAHLVYQFALPPLTLHTLLSGDATELSRWAAENTLPSSTTTFLNFLASHDGIGLRPAQDLLSPDSIQRLVAWTTARKGHISSRQVAGQQIEPYELNITYFDALAPEANIDNPSSLWIDRYLCSQAIMLALQGIPGIYFHSLIGGRNNFIGVERTGQKRSINREKFQLDALRQALMNPAVYTAQVFSRYCALLSARKSHSAFDPYGRQNVLDINPSVFAVLRTSAADDTQMLCLHNVTPKEIELDNIRNKIPSASGHDILHQDSVNTDSIGLLPYQCRWIALEHTK